MISEPWWQSAVGYQIYPISFCDANGDGIGDIPGIISKLDHLAALGVGFVWLSPVMASPMVDNGYDVSDYCAINPMFGTLADFDRMVAEAGARNIRIVMDMVINHSSDRHEWFRKSRAGDPAYRAYYIWRDPAPGGGPPDDQRAIFGGPAWTLDEASGQYYFHFFAPEQPDLNWQNPALRQDIHAMMRWWLDRGVGGFRIDVLDLLGKEIDRRIYADGPMLHPYLQELHEAVLAGTDAVTVGETWSVTPETVLLYCGRARHELSMVFQFEHVAAFYGPGYDKWAPQEIDLPRLKQIFARWQAACAVDGWNSLFWCNHDLPRAVSRYGADGPHRVASAKMLATVLHLMQGTPFIYQGEEIGMVNAGFTDISQYRDLETLNFYRLRLAAGMPQEAFLAAARQNSRDNARTPMQWDATDYAGFSTARPWIDLAAGHADINVAADLASPEGVFARYQRLVALRRAWPLVRHGRFRLLAPHHPRIFAYERIWAQERLAVIANFTSDPVALDHPDLAVVGEDVFGAGPVSLCLGNTLPPYAVHALRCA